MIAKGQKIDDRYEIVKSIGEGGMANVYLAIDTILDNRKVAIKILRGDLANDEKFIRRFKREAIAASSLNHPNIVSMYDVGEDNGNYFIVMEYIEGKTLKQLLKKRGNLTVSEAVDIMLQLTDGIAHAHDSYIVHRDIKPQNIMIQENGAIKITDFGIAMALNSTQLTQTNSVMGSVHYLPPEQASGKGSTIKSDIYSMGILFFELLTGMLPFKGDNAVEIALKHMKDPIPSIRKINPNIPQSIENIILKASAKNPKNRYNDVKEMHHDLEVALNPDVVNQAKYIYPYPEIESVEEEKSDTKNIADKPISKNEKVKKEEPKEEEVARKIEEEEPQKKVNAVIWALSIVLLLLVAGGVGMIYVASLGKEKVKIPDVSGYTVSEADNILTEAGFTVEEKVIEENSDEYPEGKVIRTEPAAGRLREKESKVTIYVSVGTASYILEDYKGQNYIEVKTKLEMAGLKVTEDPVPTASSDDLDPQAILDQEPKAGTKVQPGDTITLRIPEVYDVYPDFVAEGWTVDEVQAFCDQYGVVLRKKEQYDSSSPAGTILECDRGKDEPINKGAILTITIAADRNEPQPPSETDENSSGDSDENKTE